MATILGAGHGESFGTAISHTLGVGDLVVADVGKLDAGEDTRASVLVATIVLPAIDIGLGCVGWRSAGNGHSSVDHGGLGDV